MKKKIHDLESEVRALFQQVQCAEEAACDANLKTIDEEIHGIRCRMSVCGTCSSKLSSTAHPFRREWDGQPCRLYWCQTCYPDVAALVRRHGEAAAELERRRTLRRQRVDWRRHCREYEKAYIGSYYARCWLRTYRTNNPNQVAALDQVRKWASSERARQAVPFMLLFGPPAVGKSHLAVAAWRTISRVAPGRGTAIADFVDEGRLWERWRQAHRAYDKGSGYEGPTPDDLIEELKDARVLIWDDLGKVKMTDAWFATVFAILNHRMANDLPTLVTSNYSPSVLAGRLEPSLARRVASGVVLQVDALPAAAAAA